MAGFICGLLLAYFYASSMPMPMPPNEVVPWREGGCTYVRDLSAPAVTRTIQQLMPFLARGDPVTTSVEAGEKRCILCLGGTTTTQC